MVNLPQKIAAITAGAVLGFLALEAKPAQAAEFYDYAEFEFVFGDGYIGNLDLYDGLDEGSLSFEVGADNLNAIQSLLAGVGTKKVSLEELKSATSNVDFDFDYGGLATFEGLRYGYFVGDGYWSSGDVIGDPVFTFDSGELIGLELDLPTHTSSEGYCYAGGSIADVCDTFTEYNNFFIEGNQFYQEVELYLESCAYFLDPEFGTDFCYEPFVLYSDAVSGDINFTTIDPLELPPQSVPEPSTLAGLSLLGLGLLVKKKAVNLNQDRD
ncbi:MAG: PEP-CTERM sorting domain-containing protein [Coleofasciculus sp.]|uniref:PEP-CTERM sorting domain-containing protein n=1 Tax=Coleofasciculus sp. TaxID=3100458 RepID=UPI003A356C06